MTPRRPRTPWAASMALLAACAAVGPPGSAHNPLEIRFDATAIRPETARIPANGDVTWIGEANDYSGAVVFSESMVASFACAPDLRPTFWKFVGGYRSLSIDQEDQEDVRLPCALAPGSHPYEIWLYGEGLGEVTDDARPDRKLRGTLVVE